MPPNLIKGNCFIFSVLFIVKHPSAQLLMRWNKQSKTVSFQVAYGGKIYRYRRKDRLQSKYWFNGHVVTSKLT